MVDETSMQELLASGRTHEAFELIVETFREKVFHLALSFVRSEAGAADLAQETLLRVWKALPTYRRTASLSTWIYIIARNVCYTEVSRARKRASISLDDPDSGSAAEAFVAPEPHAAGAGMDAEVLLAQLPDKYQRVLRLFYLEQKSYDETSALLGLPTGTVKSYLFRAKKELAGIVARRVGELESVKE